MVTLNLNPTHVSIALEALESRRDAYLKTAAWYRGKASDDFVIEEVEDAAEAEEIARGFTEVIDAIRGQVPG